MKGGADVDGIRFGAESDAFGLVNEAVRDGVEADLPAMIDADPIADHDAARRSALAAWLARGQVLVSEAAGRVAGFAVLEHGLFGHGFVPLLCVRPDARREGHATRLLQQAEARCRTAKLFASANASNGPAQRLLERAGFGRSGTIENLDPGDPEWIYFKAVSCGTGDEAAAVGSPPSFAGREITNDRAWSGAALAATASAAEPGVRLRAASPHDAPAIAELLIVSRRTFLPYAPSAHPDDDVRRWVRETLIPTGSVTVADDGDTVVGVLATSTDGALSWIDQLMLLPSHVGQGIGSVLLDHALRELPQPLRLYTFQANQRARSFYERRGFRAIEFGDGSGNEERCPDVLYELREPEQP